MWLDRRHPAGAPDELTGIRSPAANESPSATNSPVSDPAPVLMRAGLGGRGQREGQREPGTRGSRRARSRRASATTWACRPPASPLISYRRTSGSWLRFSCSTTRRPPGRPGGSSGGTDPLGSARRLRPRRLLL